MTLDVFWQIGSSATIGTNAKFGGTILADQGVTINSGADVDGRIIALNMAVTLDNNTVIPEPTGVLLLGLGALVVAGFGRVRRNRG